MPAASESRRFDKLGVAVEAVSPELVTRAKLRPAYAQGLLVSDVSVTGPAYRKLTADGTILLSVINPGPRRELHTAADLEAVLAGRKAGDLITFLVYFLGQEGVPGAVTLQVGQ
ncbi:MAG: hypothetical protein NVSMB62_30040 [Acidobacteriaceae bacterium]